MGAILSRGNNFFLSRSLAETDPTHKQIVPYALIAFEDKVLHYVRGKKAGEQRLVAKGSIGIGGHMNDSDESLFALDEAAYRAGVEREVDEEITINTTFEDRIVALLNDDSDRSRPRSSRHRSRFQTGRAEGGEARGNDHRSQFSFERGTDGTPRLNRNVVADLSRFARSTAAAAGSVTPECLNSMQRLKNEEPSPYPLPVGEAEGSDWRLRSQTRRGELGAPVTRRANLWRHRPVCDGQVIQLPLSYRMRNGDRNGNFRGRTKQVGSEITARTKDVFRKAHFRQS